MTHKERIEYWRQLHEQRGFQLMPLAGKMPVKGSEGWQAACVTGRPFDPAEYPDGCNAGILTGPASGVLVLDVDDKELFIKNAARHKWALSPTLEVITGGGKGKTHHYYRYPRDGREYGNLGRAKTLGFDCRGVGGYVVAPESIHPDTGHAYKLAFSRPLADPPEWLLKLYDDRDVPQDAQEGPQGLDVDALPVSQAVKDFIVNGAPKGQRSELFFKTLCSLLGIGVGTRDIVAMLEQNPGGEKFREQGRGRHRWLDGEIRRAKAHITGACDTSKERDFSFYARRGLISGGAETQNTNENGGLKNSPVGETSKTSSEPQETSRISSKVDQLLDLYRKADDWLSTEDIRRALGWDLDSIYSYNEYLRRRNKIAKDLQRRGCHRYLHAPVGAFDFKNYRPAQHIALWLPAGLDNLVNIDVGSLISFSGETGAGKTTFSLLMARKNDDRLAVNYIYTEPDRDAFYNKMKLYEQEGEGLYRGIGAWNMTVKHVENFRATDAHVYIEPDCLNIVDWMKLTNDENVMVNDILWRCKEKVGNGVVVVMMQKDPMKPYAVGGSSTAYLATLYLTLQKKTVNEGGRDEIRRYLKVEKARNLKSGRNPEGQRLEFVIARGVKIKMYDSFQFDDEQSSTALPPRKRGKR